MTFRCFELFYGIVGSLRSYTTADGSAAAGRDYEAVSGELFFYADYDSQTIEIPLIDDGAADDVPRSFTVTLDGIKGDGAGLGSLENTTATVYLTNSGTAERRNLASMLAVTDRAPASGERPMLRGTAVPENDYDIARDASAKAVIGGALRTGAANGPISGKQVTTTGNALLQGSFSLTAPKSEQLQAYPYGEITFSSGSGGQYWSDRAYIAGGGQNDYTDWRGGSAYNDGWMLKSKDKTTATLKIPHMGQYFSHFGGRMEFNPEWCSAWVRFWCSGPQFVYGLFKLQGVEHTSLNGKPDTDHIHYYRTFSWQKTNLLELDINDKTDSVALILREYGGHSSDEPAWIKMTEGFLVRRMFNNKLKLTVHTANDGDNAGGVRTAPDGMAALDARTGVYESMKPEVTVVPGAGGVKDGKLFVGSQIKISLKNTASYAPYTGQSLDAGQGQLCEGRAAHRTGGGALRPGDRTQRKDLPRRVGEGLVRALCALCHGPRDLQRHRPRL